MPNYNKLQNGSDIRGIAIALENGPAVELTSESVTSIGRAFARFLTERLNKPVSELRIALGRDPRLSGEQLAEWITNGLTAEGANVYYGGLTSTPAMFMCCVEPLSFDAGIMITASHLPMERNGFKFFTASGGLEKEDIASILALAEEYGSQTGTDDAVSHAVKPGKRFTVDIMTPYIAGLKQRILTELGCKPNDKPFEGLRIVVDAGNGSGGFFAERILAPLGADITGSVFLEPDGHFPNHQPNPENAEAMESIREAVKSSGAELGIIFDTDVDRAGAVIPGAGGAVALDRNRLIAMMCAILNKQYGSITVVTDSITSTGLEKFITSLGCRHHRFKRGYRNVINEAKRLMECGENAIFAMETSGHGALFENYFLDDGAYIVVKLLIELVRSRRECRMLSELIATLKEPAESAEVRLTLAADDILGYSEAILKHVKANFTNADGFTIVEPNYEGVRVNADAAHGNGWFLIRRSLHEPILPCNLESNSIGGLCLLAGALFDALSDFSELNIEPLRRLTAKGR